MTNTIYHLVGELLENVQYIEWNLAVLICDSQKDNKKIDNSKLFSKMQAMTLGQIINLVKKVNIFEDDELDELEFILNKRNYLAHQFFKINDCVKNSDNKGFISNKNGELKNLLKRFSTFNQKVSDYLSDED